MKDHLGIVGILVLKAKKPGPSFFTCLSALFTAFFPEPAHAPLQFSLPAFSSIFSNRLISLSIFSFQSAAGLVRLYEFAIAYAVNFIAAGANHKYLT